MAARWGQGAETMSGAQRDRATSLEATYLAWGLRNIVYTLAPQRIIIGGGVAGLPGLFPMIHTRLQASLGAYPGLDEHTAAAFVVPPGLGGMAGPLGAVALADQAEKDAVSRSS